MKRSSNISIRLIIIIVVLVIIAIIASTVIVKLYNKHKLVNTAEEIAQGFYKAREINQYSVLSWYTPMHIRKKYHLLMRQSTQEKSMNLYFQMFDDRLGKITNYVVTDKEVIADGEYVEVRFEVLTAYDSEAAYESIVVRVESELSGSGAVKSCIYYDQY